MPPSLLSLLLLAAPPSPDLSARTAELTATARAHHATQAYEQAANTYILLSPLPGADEDAALHQAHLNLELAHATTGEPAHLCRALALARGRLAQLPADAPPRAAWEEAVADDLAELAHRGGESSCSARRVPPQVVPLLDVPPAETAPGPVPAPSTSDRAQRQLQARTAAGVTLTSMGLAFAGLMGGALVALDRGVDALRQAGDVPDGYVYPTDEQEALHRLRADTKLAQGLALGLGVASAATLATGIGLLASRRRASRTVALLPSAGPQGGTLTFRLRF